MTGSLHALSLPACLFQLSGNYIRQKHAGSNSRLWRFARSTPANLPSPYMNDPKKTSRSWDAHYFLTACSTKVADLTAAKPTCVS